MSIADGHRLHSKCTHGLANRPKVATMLEKSGVPFKGYGAFDSLCKLGVAGSTPVVSTATQRFAFCPEGGLAGSEDLRAQQGEQEMDETLGGVGSSNPL